MKMPRLAVISQACVNAAEKMAWLFRVNGWKWGHKLINGREHVPTAADIHWHLMERIEYMKKNPDVQMTSSGRITLVRRPSRIEILLSVGDVEFEFDETEEKVLDSLGVSR